MRCEFGIGGCAVLRAKPRNPDNRGYAFELNASDAWARAGVLLHAERDLVAVSDGRVLRGVHYNDASGPMKKWMTCVTGSVFEVVVDLHPGSPTLGQASSFTLWPGDEVFVPEHCGHGYVVLSGPAVVHYRLSGPRVVTAEQALLWGSVPAPWPIPEPILSHADRVAPVLDEYLRGELPRVLVIH